MYIYVNKIPKFHFQWNYIQKYLVIFSWRYVLYYTTDCNIFTIPYSSICTSKYDFMRFNDNLNPIFIIIIKKDWQCKAGRGRLTPYQSEDPSPTLPTYRGKEENGKIVEDKKGESN